MQTIGWQKPHKPPWLRVKLPSGESYDRVMKLLRSKSLHTVCEEARCPNLAECWGCGTATFLILGDRCTRHCGFCSVKSMNQPSNGSGFDVEVERPGACPDPKAIPSPPQADPGEARRVADAVADMNLRHAVITSVTRDDLLDGGASLFAETIRLIHACAPGCSVEVLIPDFKGDPSSVGAVVRSHPEVFGHNMETVPRLYPAVRPQAVYRRSLGVLQTARELDPRVITKSGVMVGLGETRLELMEIMQDLRRVQCDILTIGQYLRPSKEQLPVSRYYSPEEFALLKETALEMGFRWVESGPLVRSSYHAEAQAHELGRNPNDPTT